MTYLTVTQQQAKRAQERWWGLESLDEARALRDELRSTGVSEHRIEALYPGDFADFISGLLPVLAPSRLVYIDEDQLLGYFTALRGILDYSRRAYGLDFQLQLASAYGSADFARRMNVLQQHISDCLPAVLNAPRHIAIQISDLLWYAFTLYLNIERLSVLRSEVDRFLLDVTDGFLAHYDERHAQTVKPLQEALRSAS